MASTLEKTSELLAANGNGSFAFLLHPALLLLWESRQLAEDVWHEETEKRVAGFAVATEQLREFGFSNNHLRWLHLKGYARCTSRQTVESVPLHSSRIAEELLMRDDDLWVLTHSGAELVKHAAFSLTMAVTDVTGPNMCSDNSRLGARPSRSSPRWDAARRELRLGTRLVKQFRGRADNQELVLRTFQEENWPSRVDDPLPPHGDLDAKLRLRDTISSLNRHQHIPCIRFHGDGTGRGVIWETVL